MKKNWDAPYCCVIKCKQKPQFNIQEIEGGFEANTQSCEKHVGELLGYVNSKTTGGWVVTEI